jgi:phosphoenolpyruvate synthase/pyruvate phosphate dikinase
MTYIAEIETRVAGIPCIIGVTYFESVKGSGNKWTAVSDWDYHGYTECEYEVLDSRGRKAAWLERKVTSEINAKIEREIAENMTADDYCDY